MAALFTPVRLYGLKKKVLAEGRGRPEQGERDAKECT